MKNMNLLISVRPMEKTCGSVAHTHIHWSDKPENWGCADGSLLVILAHTISQLKRGVTGRQKHISVRKDTKHGKPSGFDQALLWPSLPLQGFGHYLHLWVQLWRVGEQNASFLHIIHILFSKGRDRVIFLKGFNQIRLPGKVSKLPGWMATIT